MPSPKSEAQRRLASAGTAGMRKNALSRAGQIASQRMFVYDRPEVRFPCIVCGNERDRRRGPICDACSPRCHGEAAT